MAGRFSFALFLLTLAALMPELRAAVDEFRLPPAATNRIDFLRDIKPIFDASCLKCHGPEKPKAHFRVDDRASLLKGGDSGVAVIAGQSAKSILIHYVSRLVPDMEMPPEGKGEPLTAQQIGLLRAWIDQEMPWAGGEPASTSVIEAAPKLGWISVSGNERKFRELNWRHEGWDGGLENFLLKEQTASGERFTTSGRALRDDYKVELTLERREGFTVRAGFEQYRKYFNDSGGYYAPYLPAEGRIDALGRDLHLDLGKAWLEVNGTTRFGLELSGGYQYEFKEGQRALTLWGPVTRSTATAGETRLIHPASRDVDERVHVLKLGAGYDWRGVRFDDHLRYENYRLHNDLATVRTQFPTLDFGQRVRESDRWDSVANAFQVQAHPREWLLLSAGYLYSHTEGESSHQQNPVDAAGQPRDGLLWSGRGIPLEQSAHVFNANAQAGLWEQMNFSAGLQSEWNRQRVFGDVNLDSHEFGDPTITNLNPARVKGDYERFTIEERFTLRNTQLPFTVLYAEARFRQESIEQFESQEENGLALQAFQRDTDARHDWRQYRAGFNTSPWSRVSLNGWAQRKDRQSDFHHGLDEKPIGFATNAYPGFITERQTISDELGTRLVVRPASWLKTTFSYRLVLTDFKTATESTPADYFLGTATPGGRIHGGKYDAHIYSFNATLTPWRRVYFYSTLSLQDSRTVTADHGNASIAPFRGRTYSALTSANYILDEQTDLTLAYDFSRSDYGQHNETAGLPLGIDYTSHGIRAGLTRRFWKRYAANVEYVWSRYDEPTSGGFNDFTANGVFGTLRIRWD